MIKKEKSYSLLLHNTFGIDVEAEQFVEFETETELVELIKNGISSPILVIGGGSNLLFMKNYSGTVLHSRICDIQVVEENDEVAYLRVGSGVEWDYLVKYSIDNGLQGLENLSAIPGEVGASAVQNVGAYGVEAGELIHSVEAISLTDASKRIFMQNDCCFAYRYSIFKNEEKGKNVITYVTYCLRKVPEYKVSYGNMLSKVEALGGLSAQNIRTVVCETRASKLPSPSCLGSAGSFFMNPVVDIAVADKLKKQYPEMPQYDTPDGRVKLSAGWLIEQCGWKGKRIGNVGSYPKQALVIVNYGGATGTEVMAFSNAVCNAVKESFGVELHPEVNTI